MGKKKLTWLGWLNKLLFQWLFVRMTRYVDKQTKKTTGFGFMGFVVPCTGWGRPYVKFLKWEFKVFKVEEKV